jgi:hypothetical protein
MRIPSLEDSADMNHVNVVLQSIYNLVPLRHKLYHDFDSEAASTINIISPLRLVLAKMWHDSTSEDEATDASIYLKDSYGKDNIVWDPFLFYSWFADVMATHEKFNGMLQWKWTKVIRSEMDESEISTEAHANSLRIDTEEFKSVNEFCSTFFSASSSKTTSRSLNSLPQIASFLLPLNRVDSTFKVEKELHIGTQQFTLKSAIIKESGSSFDCFVLSNKEDWIRVTGRSDKSVVETEAALNLISRFGYILFYVNNSASPKHLLKPSSKLVMEALTRSTLSGLARTVQKSNLAAAAARSPVSQDAFSKTKAVPRSRQVSASTAHSSPSRFNADGIVRSVSLASLPALPSKTPPPEDLAYLKSILISEKECKKVRNYLSFKDPAEEEVEASSEISTPTTTIDIAAIDATASNTAARTSDSLINRVFANTKSPDREMGLIEDDEDVAGAIYGQSRDSFWETLHYKSPEDLAIEHLSSSSLIDFAPFYEPESAPIGQGNSRYSASDDDLLISQMSNYGAVKKTRSTRSVSQSRSLHPLRLFNRERGIPQETRSMPHFPIAPDSPSTRAGAKCDSVNELGEDVKETDDF